MRTSSRPTRAYSPSATQKYILHALYFAQYYAAAGVRHDPRRRVVLGNCPTICANAVSIFGGSSNIVDTIIVVLGDRDRTYHLRTARHGQTGENIKNK